MPPPPKLILHPPRDSWDDWVNQDRLRKLTDENKELAQTLKKDLDAQRQRAAPKVTATSSKKKAAGSDLSSTRGSEERHSSAPATGRGQKRGRDYEIDKVGNRLSPLQTSSTSKNPASRRHKSSSSFEEEPIHNTASSMPSPIFPNLRSSIQHNDLNYATSLPSSPTLRRRRRLNLWQRQNKAENMADATGSTLPTESLPPAEVILSKTPPPEPRPRKGQSLMLRKYPEYPALLTAWRQEKIHPQLAQLNIHDPGNETKRQFYKAQDPEAVLMIAGIAKQDALHPTQTKSACTGPAFTGHGIVAMDINNFQEEAFHSRPAIRIVVPDHLKALLVDDWENVTKNLSLVPLPSKHPVNEILDTYFEEEKGKRRLGSAEADLLEEVVAGVKEYFDKCLGRILLYRFEREQYFEIRQLWEGGVGVWEGKGPGDVYGAEHLCRLFGMLPRVQDSVQRVNYTDNDGVLVSMPELIAQTNMDQQAVNRLREELAKLTQWLGKNSGRFFTSEYEAASQDYIDKARGV